MYLLPLALLTGPFLPDLFICLIGILITISIIKEKKYTYLNNNYFIFFLFFCFYLIARSLFAESIMLSLESSLFYFRFGLFAIGVWYLIENNNKFIKIFSIFFLFTFIFALFDGYYQYLDGISFFGIDIPGNRLSLPLNDNAILGGYLARLFPLLLAVLIYSFDLRKPYVLLILLILILTDVLIFVTGERTALGLLFLSTVFIIIFLSKYKKIRILSFLVSIALMSLIAVFNPNIKERNIDYTIYQLTENNTGSLTFISILHKNYFITAWNMFINKPLIGQGPKMFRVLCDDIKFKYDKDANTCNTHPHNSYVQILAETGILGLAFILILLFKIVILIFNHILLFIRKREYLLSDYQICLIACFLITLCPLIPSQNFFNNWISIIYYVPVGFFLHSLHIKEKN